MFVWSIVDLLMKESRSSTWMTLSHRFDFGGNPLLHQDMGHDMMECYRIIQL